jgi:Kef-type K+ transport system membrane component KefB
MAGIGWRDAASLGILMNTRGLMELIALNIGLDIGVISSTVFTIMVLMALATTLMTSPLLEWVYPARLRLVGEEVAIAEQVA